jgi:hypothetical protein
VGFVLARFVYFRALALVFAIAFVSLWVQIDGLVGSHGILPIAGEIEAARRSLDATRWRLLPTFAWWFPSDAALHAQCALGTLVALLLFAGAWPRACLGALWALYLSLVVAGQVFLSFQWDALLLQTALFSLPLAPRGFWPGLAAERPPSRLALLLVRWLLFCLMFSSGVVKLTSGDSRWLDGSALSFHYWTQPLPGPLAWYAAQLPSWLQWLCCMILFAIELGCPWLCFGPRLARRFAAAGIALLMLAIALTGNYGFFNLLTLVLCIPLLDDELLARVLPRRLAERAGSGGREAVPRTPLGRLAGLGAWALALAVLLQGSLRMLDNFGWLALRGPAAWAAGALAPFRSLNAYGLFRVMTTERREIEIQGSADGRAWQTYALPWKPDDPARRPAWQQPHMPRLDWQLWFAALSPARASRWLEPLLERVLEGEPSVLALFGTNPFPAAPPRYVRARFWDYRFATPAEHAASGDWWTRRLLDTWAFTPRSRAPSAPPLRAPRASTPGRGARRARRHRRAAPASRDR